MKTDVKSMLELRKIKVFIDNKEINALDYIEILEDNWNNLKNYISLTLEVFDNIDVKTLLLIKNKMEELENGKYF